MNRSAITIPFILTFLGACGGGTDQITRQNPPGPTGLIFSDALSLNSTELSTIGTVAAGTLAEFNDLNTRPLMSPRSGKITYDGGIFAQIGTDARYLDGGFSVVLDMASGTGRGTVGFISMSGPDATSTGLQDTTTFLDINITDISGTSLNGTITGEFSDRYAIDRQFSEEFQVDTSFDARFVDNGRGPYAGLVGTLTGTIDAETTGLDTLNGVIGAEDTIF